MITPKTLKVQVQSGFGGSFSKEQVDIDENGLPDFAIGASISELVAILRSKEVAIFSPTSELIAPTIIDPKTNGTAASKNEVFF